MRCSDIVTKPRRTTVGELMGDVLALIASELQGQAGPGGSVRNRDQALPLVAAECGLTFVTLEVASHARFVCAIRINHPPLDEADALAARWRETRLRAKR